jgi:hypothetical protein
MGPFGELIEKANAFTGALSGMSMGAKAFALATGGAMVGVTYLVSKAKEAFDDMREAMDRADESAQKLGKSRETLAADILSKGIASGQEGRATKQLIERDVSLVGNISVAAIEERKKIQEALDFVRSGKAVELGAPKFKDVITSSAKERSAEMELADMVKKSSAEDLQRLKQERDKLTESFKVFSRGTTGAEAESANRANDGIERLDRLIKAIEDSLVVKKEVKIEPVFEDNMTADEVLSKQPDFSSFDALVANTSYGVGGQAGGTGNIFGATYAISPEAKESQQRSLDKLESIDSTLKQIEKKGTPLR